MADFAGITFWKNRKASEDKVQNGGIIGVNSTKMHLVSKNSYAYNGLQEYRMVKGKLKWPFLNII